MSDVSLQNCDMIRACCFQPPGLWYLVMAAAGCYHVPWGPLTCILPLPHPPIAWPRPFSLSSLFTQQPQQAVTCGHQSALGCPTPWPTLALLPQLGSPLPAGELLLVLTNPPGRSPPWWAIMTQPFPPPSLRDPMLLQCGKGVSFTKENAKVGQGFRRGEWGAAKRLWNPGEVAVGFAGQTAALWVSVQRNASRAEGRAPGAGPPAAARVPHFLPP